MSDTEEIVLDEDLPKLLTFFESVRGRRASEDMYQHWQIPKATGGMRDIWSPNPELMAIQNRILRILSGMQIGASASACAYVNGKSIKDMAEPHIGKRVVVKLDLKDFFPNITVAMVAAGLRNSRVARGSVVLSLVADWCFLRGGLPIGAPTSPFLSNVVAANLDARLIGLCKKWRSMPNIDRSLQVIARERGPDGRSRTCLVDRVWTTSQINYTRYADDLCFSSNYVKLPEMIPAIKYVITEAGFIVNPKKVRVMRSTGVQEIVGVSLSKMGKRQRKRRDLRQRLHQIAVNMEQNRVPRGSMFLRTTNRREGVGGAAATIVTVDLAKLRGEVAHVKFLCKEQAVPLERLLERVERAMETQC